MADRVKPEFDDGASETHREAFNIKLVKDGEVTFFKVKPTTTFKRIRDAYSKSKGVDAGTYKLLYDGDFVQLDKTIAELSADQVKAGGDPVGEGTAFDVMVEQYGGIGDLSQS
eukprot:jgi/Mesvir1/7156/Mv02516-RA.1